jgi:hypothetical protein
VAENLDTTTTAPPPDPPPDTQAATNVDSVNGREPVDQAADRNQFNGSAELQNVLTDDVASAAAKADTGQKQEIPPTETAQETQAAQPEMQAARLATGAEAGTDQLTGQQALKDTLADQDKPEIPEESAGEIKITEQNFSGFETPEGQQAYDNLKAGLEHADDPEVFERYLSERQLRRGENAPGMQAAYAGTSIEKAVGDYEAVDSDPNIRWLGTQNPGRSVPDFVINDGGRDVNIDITGGSDASKNSHLEREYMKEHPSILMQYASINRNDLRKVFEDD